MSHNFRKFQVDLTLIHNFRLNEVVSHLVFRIQDGLKLPDIYPGQFVQIDLSNITNVLLRRPISVHDVTDGTDLHLLVARVGKGTNALCEAKPGMIFNFLLPLGNGFPYNVDNNLKNVLLIGGGVGAAPLLYYAKWLKNRGIGNVDILLAVRSNDLLLRTDEFAKFGNVYLCTDDGSAGFRGLASEHPILNKQYDFWCVCGPLPMMKSISAKAKLSQTKCFVSLENKMACGIGACLCCVENTKDKGNVCVCQQGPVFDTDRLRW